MGYIPSGFSNGEQRTGHTDQVVLFRNCLCLSLLVESSTILFVASNLNIFFLTADQCQDPDFVTMIIEMGQSSTPLFWIFISTPQAQG
jgi:hypothetical protein